jgi:hypothetical protein
VATRRGAVAFLACAGLFLPGGAVAAVPPGVAENNGLWIAPKPGGAWDYIDQVECTASNDSHLLWSNIPYVNVDYRHGLPIVGQVRDIGGVALTGRAVHIFSSGFREGEQARFEHTVKSGSNGMISYKTRGLRRDTFVWAELDKSLLGTNIGTCPHWVVTPGISDPIVVDVRPILHIGAKKTSTDLHKATVRARLEAVNPRTAGTVILQRRVRGRWTGKGKLKPDARGNIVIKLSFVREGTYSYRLRFTPRKGSKDYSTSAERRFSVNVDFPSPRHGTGSVNVRQGSVVTLTSTKRADVPCLPTDPKCK